MTHVAIVTAGRNASTRACEGSPSALGADNMRFKSPTPHSHYSPGPNLDDLLQGATHQTAEQGRNAARRVAVVLGSDGLPAAIVSRAGACRWKRRWCPRMRSGRARAGLVRVREPHAMQRTMCVWKNVRARERRSAICHVRRCCLAGSAVSPGPPADKALDQNQPEGVQVARRCHCFGR